MRYALVLCSLLLGCSRSTPSVERGLVGTWELTVPNVQGVARWVWEIHANGTYAFHAEGPGGVPAHSGTFAAQNGRSIYTAVDHLGVGRQWVVSTDSRQHASADRQTRNRLMATR